MIKYFKGFKNFIPTWVICIFAFFGIFVWPLIVAVALMVLQAVQYKKIKNDTVHEVNKHEVNKKEDITRKILRKKIIDLKKRIEDGEIELYKCKESHKSQIKVFEKELNNKNSEIEEIKLINKSVEQENIDLKLKIRDLEESSRRNQEEQFCSQREENSFVLCSGEYKGGISIPTGIYDLEIVQGCGVVDVEKEGNFDYLFMSADEKERKESGRISCYKNLEITNLTKIKISGHTKIKLKKSEFCTSVLGGANSIYYVEKEKLEKEIDDVKKELKVINNKLIEKYYVFSDYDGITSQECKNKLVLSKTKEKALRQKNKDVYIVDDSSGKKNIERTVRQVLRNFNSECDNIILNNKSSNIDLKRNKIKKSFETINTLFSVDGVSLTSEILEVKLEQATIMYTYDLKCQQEKEIQRSIKEQMLEEAKVQKEIEDQRKKIDKDLQQHTSEVNKLMKYLQKTQLDLEKELYLEKIKELEQKIKHLESEKENVLEREANAKAGFVYIISNIGSFGENIYKIGMTRRLEPMDRIKELSSASVPFEFDVHAMIFSSNAPELENMLHKHFEKKSVNKVNPRKEFYNVDIEEVEKVVKENYNDTVQFTKIPIAMEYRETLKIMEAAQ